MEKAAPGVRAAVISRASEIDRLTARWANSPGRAARRRDVEFRVRPTTILRAMRSNGLILLPTSRLHGTHSSQIERQADELELGLHTVQSSQAELTQPQHALDPAIGRLGDPLAPAAGRTAFVGLRLGGHRCRVRVGVRIDPRLALAFAAGRHHQLDRQAREPFEVVFAAASGAGQALPGNAPVLVFTTCGIGTNW